MEISKKGGNLMIRRATDYVYSYKDLLRERDRALSFINDFLNSQKAEVNLSPQLKLEIKDINIGDKFIAFTFLDFNICIELSICTTKKVGFIKWFNKLTESDGKPKKECILMDSFDRSGDIATDNIKDNEFYCSFGTNFNLYLAKTLMLFCEKIDLSEFETSSARTADGKAQ
jgi:hypothetical protein